MKAVLIRAVIVLLVLYVLVVAGLAVAMSRPPETFARMMARAPAASFLVLPFETLWLTMREGGLKVGDTAPDFILPTFDKTSEVRLSAYRGSQPVVLVFGSYT